MLQVTWFLKQTIRDALQIQFLLRDPAWENFIERRGISLWNAVPGENHLDRINRKTMHGDEEFSCLY
jgi:hypothetical protein